jgi:hypothetical protein
VTGRTSDKQSLLFAGLNATQTMADRQPEEIKYKFLFSLYVCCECFSGIVSQHINKLIDLQSTNQL